MPNATSIRRARTDVRRLSTTPWSLFAGLVGVFLVYDFVSYQAPGGVAVAFVLAVAAGVVGLGLVSVRWGLAAFVVALVFADDISRLDPVAGYLTSILTFGVGGVAIGNLVALALIGVAVLVAMLWVSRQPRAAALHRIDVCIVGILAIYALATVHAYVWWFRNPRGVINDLNLPIMLAGIYFLVRWSADTPGRIVWFWKLFLAVCAAKAVAWLIYFLLGIGFAFGTALKVSNESGRVILILVFAWALVLQERGCPVRRRERLLGLAWVAAAGIGLLVQSQRGPWLMAAFAFLVLLAFGRMRDRLRWAMAGAAGLIVTFAAVSYWMPEAFDTIRYHASTLRVWDTQRLESSTSTMIRIYEFMNIHAQMVDNNNLILGEGPGATFSDRYHQFPFGLFPGDYTWQEIESRTFQNPHGLLQNLMLNLGYGGMVVYLGLIGYMYWSCLVLVRRADHAYLRAIALALLAFLPAMVYNSWSAKNNMLLGVLLGILGCLWRVEMAGRSVKARPNPEPAAPQGHDAVPARV